MEKWQDLYSCCQRNHQPIDVTRCNTCPFLIICQKHRICLITTAGRRRKAWKNEICKISANSRRTPPGRPEAGGRAEALPTLHVGSPVCCWLSTLPGWEILCSLLSNTTLDAATVVMNKHICISPSFLVFHVRFHLVSLNSTPCLWKKDTNAK